MGVILSHAGMLVIGVLVGYVAREIISRLINCLLERWSR